MYQPTDWRNHTTDKPGRYNITKNEDDGTYNITRAGNVMQQGTPQASWSTRCGSSPGRSRWARSN